MMKFRKPLMLAVTACASSALLMLSCGDSIVEASAATEESAAPANISTSATLNVTVLDNSTGTVVNGAKVSLLSAPGGQKLKSVVSSVYGTATFSETYVGNQYVLIEKDGYAGIVYPTAIGRDNTSQAGERFFIAEDGSFAYPIYPLSSALEGNLYYLKDGTTSTPAGGASVRLTVELPNGVYLVNKIFEIKTAAVGTFKIENLPAVGNNYSLIALEKEFNGKIYVNTPYSGALPSLIPEAGERLPAAVKFEYRTTAAPFIYLGGGTQSNAPIIVEGGETLSLKFSDMIDAGKISVYPVSLSPNLPIDLEYKDDSLKITPRNGWNAGQDVTVTVTGNLKSVSGGQLAPAPTYVYVRVKGKDLSDSTVAGLIVDSLSLRGTGTSYSTGIPIWYSTSVPLRWKRLEGASGYYVFRMWDDRDYYELASTVSNNNKDTAIGGVDYKVTSVNLSPSGQLTDKTSKFVIQAYNNFSRSALAGAAALEVLSRPTVTNGKGGGAATVADTSVYFGDVNYGVIGGLAGGSDYLLEKLQNAAADRIGPFVIEFTEPMDVTIGGTGGLNWGFASTGNQTGISRLQVLATDVSWSNAGESSDRHLTFYITVVAGTAYTAASIDVNTYLRFTGLQSKRGAPFFVEYTGDRQLPASVRSKGKIIRNTLDFRLLVNSAVW